MEYKELSKIYHMNYGPTRDSDLLRQEMLRRNADSTFSTGINTPSGELFVAVPRELSLLNEKVLRAERKVSRLMRDMPGIASNAVLRSLVLDEVVSSNAIEDIHSTRRQVKDALEARAGATLEERRFRELGTLYLNILDGEAEMPESPADIRKIYDRVMDGELTDAKQPDGELFRKDGVDITDGGVRILHSGLEPESKITEAMEVMLALVQGEDMPATYAAIAAHYIFEYAHPFYDGNGRTGRYLLSLFLSEPLSLPTVLSLSRTIAENRTDYYHAFRTAENPLNRGELTFFVYAMLELVRKAQIGIIERLECSRSSFDALQEKISKVAKDLSLREQECQAVFMLMQYETFGLMGDARVDDIAEHLHVGNQMARIYLGALEEKGVVSKRRLRNPLTFALRDEFKERFAIAPLSWNDR